MTLNELLTNLLYFITTVAIPIILTQVVNFLKVKIKNSNAITDLTNNEKTNIIVNNALSNIMDAVLYVNQTYVDSLKKSGRFSDEAQKKALELAYNEAIKLISDEAKTIIEQSYGSLQKWVYLQIEIAVNSAKK